MNRTLLCTVGTSLFNKYRNIQINALETTPLRHETYQYLNNKNYIGFAKSLLKEDDDNEILGAEICSIHHIMKSEKITALDNIIFLVSDTEDGRATGEVLCRYYNDSRYNISGRKDFAVYEVIDKLNDYEPAAFKNIGLRNLVKKISDRVMIHGKDKIIINATGGYKAQILFAGVVGQSLGIPVYYLFEKFNEIIELPPQPISFDPEFWLDNQDVFFALEKSGYVGSDFDEKWFNNKDPRFESLLTIEIENNRIFLMLSPTGEIFHQMFLLKYHQNNSSLPKQTGRKEKPHIGDHHMPRGIYDYLEKLTGYFPFIVKCSTISLNKGTATNLFTLKSHNNRKEIIGSYTNEYTVNFIIQTTSKDTDEMTKAVIHMNENWLK